jgi:hypothetical protein
MLIDWLKEIDETLLGAKLCIWSSRVVALLVVARGGNRSSREVSPRNVPPQKGA